MVNLNCCTFNDWNVYQPNVLNLDLTLIDIFLTILIEIIEDKYHCFFYFKKGRAKNTKSKTIGPIAVVLRLVEIF